MSKTSFTDEHKKLLILLIIAFVVYIPLNAFLSLISKSIGFDSLFKSLDPVKLQVIKSYLISVGIIPTIFTGVGKFIGIREWKQVLLLFFVIFFLLTTFFTVIA